MDRCLNLQLLPIATFPTHVFGEFCFFTCLNCRFANIWSLKYELRKDGCDLVSRYHQGQGFPGGLVVKILPAMQETPVWSLGGKDPLKKEMATHSSILAWRIPWTEETGRLQFMGLQRVGHDCVTNFLLLFQIQNHFQLLCQWELICINQLSWK